MSSFVNIYKRQSDINITKQHSYTYSRKYTELQYDSEIQTISGHSTSRRDLRKEMILYFYTSMLPCLIKKKVVKVNESAHSIHSLLSEDICCSASLIENDTVVSGGVQTTESNLYQSPLKSPSVAIGPSAKKKRSLKSLKKRQERASKHSKLRKSQLHIPSNLFRKTYARYSPIAVRWIVDRVEEYVRIEFKNNNTYEGTVYCNMLHGQGKYTWSNGTVYEGEFKNNEITGAGRFQFPDQSVYTGEVYKNYRHGTGLLFPSMSPCIYKGEFYLNSKHGFGWQLFSNDNTYEGEWVNDQMNGQGCRKYPSGAIYNGKFAMGKRHGQGVAVMKNHDVYTGEWSHGERDGFGDYIWNVKSDNCFAVPVQSFYYGSWAENKRDGIGVINFGMQGGSRYAGYFSNNAKHGSGVIVCENGHVIESSPLFINDKPVHVSDSGNLETSQPLNSSIELSIIDEETLRTNISSSRCSSIDSMKFTRQEKLLRRFPLDQKLPFATPSSDARSAVTACRDVKQNKNNADVYNAIFPKNIDKYSSLNIPIGVSSELIDLNAHIYKIIEYKSNNILQYCKNEDNNSDDASCISRCSSIETYTDYELHKFEEKLIRKTISQYLNQLRRIYYQYGKIGCIEEQKPNFKPWLMRICFWQLYRDCKIPQKGLSLIDIDLMFSEKSTFDFYVVHNPFEIIYFWQYLESLLHVALKLYSEQFIYTSDGVLKQSFEFLMENDILPNAGHFTGSALFEYRDVIPIRAAYDWYKSFGEPHSAKQFYRNICKLKRTKQRVYTTEFLNLPYIQIGRNVVNCGNKFFYFEDEEYFIPSKPIPPKVKSLQHEEKSKLFFLSDLKPRKIANILVSICPAIKNNKDIINFEYKLSFLEFYEIILLCTREKVKIQKKNTVSRAKEQSVLVEVTHELKKNKKKPISILRKSKKAQG